MSISLEPQRVWEAEIAKRLEQGDMLEFTLDQFARTVGANAEDETLRTFIDQLILSGAAEKIEAYRCPMPACKRVLNAASAPYSTCPYCHADYQEEGVEVQVEFFYRLIGENSRDIRWMIIIHGMNSRAKWQEEFSWQIANRLSYSAPVFVYKYGWATIDVLVRWMHRRHAKQLGERMRIAIEQAAASQKPSKPDVVAHSFGTYLLSLVLTDPQFDELKFGRIITAGSIIRPDFDWDDLIANGRLEAVLNHVGAKDNAVPAAQFAIPGTGPGGKFGYLAKTVFNVREPTFGHSDFFVPQNLREQIADGGLWHNFLTHPLEHFTPAGAFEVQNWKSASVLSRVPARCLGLAIFILAGPFSWLRRRFDP